MQSEDQSAAISRFETIEFKLGAGTMIVGLAGYWSTPDGIGRALTLTAIVAGLVLLGIVEWEVRHAN